MSAIGNYLKKLANSIRGVKASKESNQPDQTLPNNTSTDISSIIDQARIVTPKKKSPSRAHMSDFTIF